MARGTLPKLRRKGENGKIAKLDEARYVATFDEGMRLLTSIVCTRRTARETEPFSGR